MVKPFATTKLCLIACLLGSSSAWAVDLQTIYQWAVMQDPTYAGAEATRLSKREAFPQAFANVLPNLSASANTQFVKTDRANTSDYNQNSASLLLQQPLFNASNWVQLKQASYVKTGADYAFDGAAQALILKVAQQYFLVLSANDALAFASHQKEAFEQRLAQIKQHFDAGVAPIADLQDAQARRDTAAANQLLAEKQLEDAYEKLREITGSPIEELAVLSQDAPLLTPDPEDEDAWVDMAEQNNPDLLALRYTRSAAKSEIWKQRAQHLPTLNAFAELSRSKSPTYNNVSISDRTVGLTASMNLFSGGSVLSQTRQARADYLKSDEDWELLYRQTVSNTRQSYRGMLTSREQVVAFRQAVLSNQSALEASKVAYEVGTRTIVDVLDAETNLLQAIQNESQARYNLILQYLQLKQQAGILSPADIVDVNQWLS